MTIAACYLSMEGVVFGADSTSTIPVKGPSGWESHHFDYGQKIFEVGRESQLGVAIWGLGSFGDTTSYRTMIAELGDELAAAPRTSVEEVARALGARVWTAFQSLVPPSVIDSVREIKAREEDKRSPEDSELLARLGSYGGGFCVGGCCPPSRAPAACQVTFDTLRGVSEPESLKADDPRFWGAPNMVDRLIYGCDFDLLDRIQASDKWSGTVDDLYKLASESMLNQPRNLPLREAVDWVYASVFATIKAFKFSHFAPICGGPVEIAVISTDRPFRWVKHKLFDAAI